MATDLQQRPDVNGGDLNPGQSHSDDLFDDIANNYGDTADPTQEDSNIASMRDAEENPDGDPGLDGVPDSDEAEPDPNTRSGRRAIRRKARETKYAERDKELTAKQEKARQEAIQKREAKFKKNVTGNSKLKKKMAVAGALAGGSAIASVLIFLAMLPLKIEHLIVAAEKHFAAASAQAVDTETENLFSQYVTQHVLPGMQKGGCHSTIDAHCVATGISGSGPVATLFTAWKDGRLEQKMATKYGIVIGAKGNSFYIATNGHYFDFKQGENIFDHSRSSATRSEIRAAVREGLKGASLYDRVFTRFKIGKLLERKYGIKRCLIACDTRDKFTDKRTDKIQAGKAYLINRVITPFSDSQGLVLLCIISGDCDTNPDQTNDDDPNHEDPEKVSKFQKDLQAQLAKYIAEHGSEKLVKVIERANGISQDGLTKYITKAVAKSIANKLGGEEAAAATGKVTEKLLPWVGWITFTAAVVDFIDNGPEQLQAMNYSVDASAAVATFSSYKTVVDELHSGHIDATELGSFANALDNGGFDATSTPLANEVLHSGGKGTSKNDPCQDGKPPSAADKICPEEKFNTGNKTLNSIHDGAASIPGWSALAGVSGPIKGLSSAISGVTGSAVDHILSLIPYYKDFQKMIANLAGDILKSLVSKILPNIFSDGLTNQTAAAQPKNSLTDTQVSFWDAISPSASADTPSLPPTLPGGGRMYDLIIGGSDIANNKSCMVQLGCRKLTNQEAAYIQNQQTSEDKAAFESESFFARMFDTTSPYSMVSRMAMDMPSSMMGSVNQLFGGFLGNPAGKLVSSFGSVFTSGSAFAATPATGDPFGIIQYGYTSNDIPSNPEKYWDDHCKDHADNPSEADGWFDNQTKDDTNGTGEAVAKKTNPCLLIQASVQASGGIFDSSLLPAGSQNDGGSGTLTTTDNGGGSKLNIVSYNAKGANHDPVYKPRMDKFVKILSDKDVGVAGLQEMETSTRSQPNQQLDYLMSKVGSTYGSYSKSGADNVIIWNKTRFTQVGAGHSMPNLKYCGAAGGLFAPYVLLSDNQTGQKFYVLDTHDPADEACGSAAVAGANRDYNAHQHPKFIAELAKAGYPIFFTGDFNSKYILRGAGNQPGSGDRNDIPYCTLTKNNLMRDAYDAWKGRSGYCPTTDYIPSHPDHIFLSPNVKVNDFIYPDKGSRDQLAIGVDGSDHPTLFVSAEIPGNAAANGSGQTTVGSYNLSHEIDNTPKSCRQNQCAVDRSQRQADTIAGKSGSPAFDIVATQETSQPQQKRLMQDLSNYASFPVTVPASHGVAIFWDTTKYRKTDSGFITAYNNVSQLGNNTPWVKLESKSGQVVYMLSSHSPNDSHPNATTAAAARLKNAKFFLAWAKSKEDGKSIVLVGGDFNKSGNSPAYCTMIAGGFMQHVHDLQAGNNTSGGCPNASSAFIPIDQLYVSPISGLTASGFKDFGKFPNAVTSPVGTDHGPVEVTLSSASLAGGSN